ncbi:MAG: hypothetical protein ACHQF0_15860 [Chitinophagales bacterium]
MYQPNDKPIPRTRSKILLVFSRIATFVFHPLFMTAIMAFAIYKLAPDDFSNFSFLEFKKWFAQLLLYTVLLPFVLILLFRVSGLISNPWMRQSRDRIPPLLATIVFYFLAYNFFISHYNFPLLFKMLLLGCCGAIIIVFVVNFFYKVSVHTTAVAILPGICISLMLNESLAVVLPFLLALLVAAIVGIIRWLLGTHTIGQILLGYAIGILTQLGAYFYLNT